MNQIDGVDYKWINGHKFMLIENNGTSDDTRKSFGTLKRGTIDESAKIHSEKGKCVKIRVPVWWMHAP
jgi:hypothetical protein